MASIRKRHNCWEVRVRRGNNPTKCRSFTKQADAKIWAYQTELELERASAGISPAPVKLKLFEAKNATLIQSLANIRVKTVRSIGLTQ